MSIAKEITSLKTNQTEDIKKVAKIKNILNHIVGKNRQGK